MITLGQQITFKELIHKHGHIHVPMIQRDYAQGRSSEAEVRDEFLDVLLDALMRPLSDKSLPLNLDFIYGEVVGAEETRFLPLDGQQRLTTLFLLHWYLAWIDGHQADFNEILSQDGKSRFAYRVRSSSTEFFDELVNFHPAHTPASVDCLSGLIKNQPWYFRYWRLDPTIQSTLSMLDAIHARFADTNGLYTRLTDVESPAITFQLLDLENFGLSDDLYIKMNARGKPLTAFETFKARFEQDLEGQFKYEARKIGDEDFSMAEFFSRRMDTKWADYFWAHRDRESNLFDDAVMNLLRAVAIVSLDPKSDSYVDDIWKLRDPKVNSSYAFFESSGWISRPFSELLILLLETWIAEGTDIATQLPDDSYLDEADLIEELVTRPASLRYAEIVKFVGYTTFLTTHSEHLHSNHFQEWMRVVANLADNTVYERPYDMQRSVQALHDLASISDQVLEHFADDDEPTAGFYKQQVVEEKLKAELILANDRWRALIIDAEGHGYFRGQIEFLLDFCGALDKFQNSPPADWDSEEHNTLQVRFEAYFAKARLMFTNRGLIAIDDFLWERALLCVGNYLLRYRQNFSLLVNASTEHASWKRLLRGTKLGEPGPRALLKELWDRIDVDQPIEAQLETIIANAKGLEPWRRALVDTPAAIRYCEKRAIRWWDDNTIYLLKKSQLNGAHAELLSFCLFHNHIIDWAKSGELAGFERAHYDVAYDTSTEPCISLNIDGEEHSFTVYLECENGAFYSSIEKESLAESPELEEALLDLSTYWVKDAEEEEDVEYGGQYHYFEHTEANLKSELVLLAERLSELGP